MRKVIVAVPGACGELVQGTLDGVPCLVSCPIDRRAELELTTTPGEGRITTPATMPKTRRALQLALAALGRWDVDVKVERRCGLPEAKGYASSTADILAALFGLGRALGERISPEWATRLALRVEPTDSLAWDGLALLAHRDGKLMKPLEPPPPLCVLALDWGGTVDTLEFNRADRRAALRHLAPLHREAFAMLRAGIALGDIELIGRAATLSAQAHQRILFKPQLEAVVRLAKAVGAAGVCVAHSGTLIGVLLRPRDATDAAAYIISHLPDVSAYSLHRVIGGGPRYIEREPLCSGG